MSLWKAMVIVALMASTIESFAQPERTPASEKNGFAPPVSAGAAGVAALPTMLEPPVTMPGGKPSRQRIALGRTVLVQFEDLDQYRRMGDVNSLVLYLDGHPVASKPRPGPGANQLLFDLEWLPEIERHWGAVVGRPRFDTRDVLIQVGTKDGRPFLGTMHADLETLDTASFWLFAGVLMVLCIGFWLLARRSDMLRDGTSSPGKGRRPFSLARTQMAIWFFVVIAAFFFIWIVTGSLTQLTVQVLALMGISVGTAFGAAVIDAKKETQVSTKMTELDAERLRLETEIAAAMALSGNLTARIAGGGELTDSLKEQLARVEAEIAQKRERIGQILQEQGALTNSVWPRASEGFFKDLLTDENGVGFHRFQIAIWTILLVLIFGFIVYRTLGMPPFPTELLALMGISSGTYLGFKVPEAIG